MKDKLTPEELVDVDQNIVRAVKEEFRTQGRLKPTYNSPQLDKAAVKAACLCKRLDCDPAIYVAAQYAHVSLLRGQNHLLPTQLAGPSAEENVGKYRSIVNLGTTWEGLYKVQKGYLVNALTKTQRSLESILLDPSIDFSPWFRCLITKEPIPAVLKKYGYQATEELKSLELKTFLDGLSLLVGVKLGYSRLPRYTS